MPSSLTWLDHDAQARERSLRILALFQEKESRDELGLGSIRDAFSDQLFPGTSTIQTRLRYMLFIPWAYQQLEARRTRSTDVGDKMRRLEYGLVAPLLDSLAPEDRSSAGIFGRMAGRNLKRWPSSIYWAGLASWGIHRSGLSQEEYNRSLDNLYLRRDIDSARQNEGAEPDPTVATWHTALPDAPKDFPAGTTLDLTEDEAAFLRDRIVGSHPRSLLACLALHGQPSDVRFPWEHPDQARFEPDDQELLLHARLFSDCMNGAAILYNVSLADIADQEDKLEKRRADFTRWWEALDLAGVQSWELSRLWELTVDKGHNISWPTRRFIEAWVGMVRDRGEKTLDDPKARSLVRAREMSLKRGRSRFTNRRALDQWGGASGLGRYVYRWPTAQTFLNELFAGLGRD